MQITGGALKSRKLQSPKGDNVRPTLSQIRESVFSILWNLVDFEEASFLDAFAGSGIMGFEAISRGFKSVSFIEKDRNTYNLLKTNASTLNVSADFYFGDTIKVLKKIDKSFDVIYIDPPYLNGLYEKALGNIKITSGGYIILEHLKETDIDFAPYKLIKQKIYGQKVFTILQE